MFWLLIAALAQPPSDIDPESAAKAEKIAYSLRDALRGYETETVDVGLTIVDSNGARTERKLRLLTTEIDGDGDRMRMEMVAPPDVAGMRMLTWSHAERQDDQWLYLPAMSSIKRIAGGNRAASFMGSEFAFEDFGANEVEKYAYNYLRQDTHLGREVHIYERFPTDKKSGYSKQVLYSDIEYKQPLVVEYYDRKGELLKVATSKSFRSIDGRWAPGRIEMENVQTNKSSIMTMSNRALGEELDPTLFDSVSLGE